MANLGGARPGAGRPKGSKVTRTQELVKKAIEGGVTPLDVLIGNMRFYHKLATDKLDQIYQTDNVKEKAKILRVVDAFYNKSGAFAVDAAPYIHPKLSSVKADVNIANVEAALTELE